MSRKKQVSASFDTFDDFLDYCGDETIAKRAWQDAHEREDASDDQRGTRTYQGALELARNGWAQGVQDINATASNSTLRMEERPSIVFDVAGEMPLVAAFCAGEQAHMMTFATDEAPARNVRVLADGGVNCKVGGADIIAWGGAVVACLQALQANGYNPVLTWHIHTTTDTFDAEILAAVTHPDSPLDVDRVAFALANPAMLRRLIFFVMETNPWSALGGALGGATAPRKGTAAAFDVVLPNAEEGPSAVYPAFCDYLTFEE